MPKTFRFRGVSELPSVLRLRISKGTTRKGKQIIICSNIPTEEANKEIFQFTKERWNIEKDLKEFKNFLEAEFIVTKTPDAFLREMSAKILGFNILKMTMSLTKKSSEFLFYKSKQHSFRAFF